MQAACADNRGRQEAVSVRLCVYAKANHAE